MNLLPRPVPAATVCGVSRRLAALVLLASLSPGALAADTPAPGRELWFYLSTNLLVDANVERLEQVFRQAAGAGYTAVLLSDYKFSRLGTLDERYFRNVERVKRLARDLRLEVVPALFPLGYSSGLLSHDPDLAEGLPVKGQLLVVKDGQAQVEPDPPIAFRDGSFKDLKAWDWKDDLVVADGSAALVRNPRGKNARIVQKLKVSPFRQYHVQVRVKTQDFDGEPRVTVLAGSRSLQQASLGVQRTQDWALHHAVFNSLEASEVTVYFGAWGAGEGSLWWSSARIEEVGFLNLVRRDGAPLSVVREGDVALLEGRDFEPLADPRLGAVPWPGEYEVWHAPPVLRTRLPAGTRLRASYFHAITVNEGQVMICPSEPKTLELLRDEARRVHQAWGARTYFMSHDEIRVLNWDPACARVGKTAGAVLAANVRKCTEILREVSPGARIFVWSDMFDPAHNAVDEYYLVNGSLKGSWEGLDRGVAVACWYHEKRAESLAWFTGRGHPVLIAGYYDAAPARVEEWLDAAKGKTGVLGVMYTTWRSSYNDLQDFARRVLARSGGPPK